MVLNYIKTYIVVSFQNARGYCIHCISSIRESRYTPSTLAALVRDISSIYNNLYLHKDFQRIIQLLYCNTLQRRKSR